MYEAQVFQILIASPDDVQEERKILADVIYEWNSVNSRDRKTVLLPLRWETHGSPELGASVQTVINQQVVDHCDMAIGVFWTRLGTPTSAAESGTAEEIERVGAAGKHVMLYFSRAMVDPEQLDIAEYQRLKNFKVKTYPRGLLEHYGSITEFREKLTRQLSMKILALIKERQERGEDSADAVADLQSTAPLALLLRNTAEDRNADFQTSPAIIRLPNVICTNPDEIPDFDGRIADDTADDIPRLGTTQKPNSDYYRELVGFFAQRSAHHTVNLALRNLAPEGVRDIYADMRIEAVNGEFSFAPPSPAPAPPRKFIYMGSDMYMVGRDIHIQTVAGNMQYNIYYNQSEMPALRVDNRGTDYPRAELALPVVQTGRTIIFPDEFTIDYGGENAIGRLYGTVFSSNFQPFPIEISIKVEVIERKMTYQEILADVQKFLL